MTDENREFIPLILLRTVLSWQINGRYGDAKLLPSGLESIRWYLGIANKHSGQSTGCLPREEQREGVFKMDPGLANAPLDGCISA